MKFIEQHFPKIILGLLVIIFLQQCGASRKLSSLEKKAKAQESRLDSLTTFQQLSKELQIEGLKAEKRMIQSTDRKMLDVNRQSQIDAEIKKIENGK